MQPEKSTDRKVGVSLVLAAVLFIVAGSHPLTPLSGNVAASDHISGTVSALGTEMVLAQSTTVPTAVLPADDEAQAAYSSDWTLVEALSAIIVLVLLHTAVRVHATSVQRSVRVTQGELAILAEAFRRRRTAEVRTYLERMGLVERRARFLRLLSLLLGPPATCLMLVIGVAWYNPDCTIVCTALAALLGAALLGAARSIDALRLTALGRSILAATGPAMVERTASTPVA